MTLPGAFAVYGRLVVAGFRRQWQYKLAMFAGLFTNSVFGLVRGAVLGAAVGSAGAFAGYDAGSVGAYVWISQGLLGAITFMNVDSELAERVRTGDIAIDFLRPVDIQLAYLAEDLGRAACTLLPRALPSVLLGIVVFDITMPTTPGSYLLGVVSVLLAVAISFLGLFAVTMIGFRVVETRGFRTVYQIVGTFLAGLFVPVHLFPEWLRTVANATPFPAMLQAPVDVLSGRVVGLDAVQVVGTQVCWVVVVGGIGRVLLAAGRRRLEVQGG